MVDTPRHTYQLLTKRPIRPARVAVDGPRVHEQQVDAGLTDEAALSKTASARRSTASRMPPAALAPSKSVPGNR
jgi:protein gp37